MAEKGKIPENYHPSFEAIRNYRNEHNSFASMLGIEIKEISEGYARGEMNVTSQYTNPQGSVQGGCIYTIADATGGAAASCRGMKIATVDANFHYLRAGLGTTKLVATTRELKSGKKLMTYDVAVADQDGKVLAEGIFTYINLNMPLIPPEEL